jgi:hypothetical protein
MAGCAIKHNRYIGTMNVFAKIDQLRKLTRLVPSPSTKELDHLYKPYVESIEALKAEIINELVEDDSISDSDDDELKAKDEEIKDLEDKVSSLEECVTQALRHLEKSEPEDAKTILQNFA